MTRKKKKPLLKRLKNGLIYRGAQAAYYLVTKLPRRFGIRLFGVLGRFAFHLTGVDKKRTIEHLRFIYGDKWNEEQIQMNARRVYRELGKNLFDMVYLSRLEKDDFNRIVRYNSLEEFDQAYRRGKGVIVITAHLGCFEMLLHFFAIHGYRSFAIGRKMFEPRLEQLIRKTRSGYNIEYLDRSGNTMKIVRFLKEGKAFGVLIDQDTSVEGVFAPFLGHPAFTPSGPVKLAMKMGIPAFVVTTWRCGDNTHYVNISNELKMLDTGDFEADLVKNVETANDLICEAIKKNPMQWVWMHRRWKSREHEVRNGQ